MPRTKENIISIIGKMKSLCKGYQVIIALSRGPSNDEDLGITQKKDIQTLMGSQETKLLIID